MTTSTSPDGKFTITHEQIEAEEVYVAKAIAKAAPDLTPAERLFAELLALQYARQGDLLRWLKERR